MQRHGRDSMPNDPQVANRDVQDVWNQIAVWWDEEVGGEGNENQQTVIGPATERLLALQPGESVLDCACGNGSFTRRMAQLGARVVAFDFSERFLERARARTTEYVERIEYHLIDATAEKQMLALGQRRFDAAVCTMAIMDMAEIEPLLCALSQLLKVGGRFVFSVLHPCFASQDGTTRVVEVEDRNGEIITTYSVKVSRYIQPAVVKCLTFRDQPVPQYHFHRPISDLFDIYFRAGFVLDGLEEPVYDRALAADRPLSWKHHHKELPAFLVARMRLL
jgi:2-polyprenyl-3-methyl-5-hydroxy-6-metoxy-1,4-benzoquinol methylase